MTHKFLVSLRMMHRALTFIETAGIFVAAVGVLLMMVLTAIDVVLRYVLASPLSWWYDFLMQYVLIAAFYLAFSYTLAHHGHLAVDFFMRKIPQKWSALALFTGFLIAAILLFLIAQRTACEAVASYQHQDVLAGVIAWPVWVTKTMIAWAMLIMACRSLHFSVVYLIHRLDMHAFEKVGLPQRKDDLEEAMQ